MVERSQRYLFHIVEEVEKRDMPTEIALLPMIESAYNPKAYSKSSASGIWQFIPSTGKHFGLKQDWWVDNRRNIIMATDAALTYLQKLHTMFGAWDLALAAYNAGEGTVGRAIERNRKLGLPTDYESLNLPDETRNYVPKLQAVKNLMTHPSNYGLEIPTIANTPYFAKVSAPARIDTHLVAKLAEINHEEFLALNPSYDRPLINNEHQDIELLLPIMAAQTFRTNLANYEKPLVSWQTYQAKRGESIDKIASKFGINLARLRNVNALSSQAKMKNSTTLLVPKTNSDDNTTLTVIEDNEIEVEPSSKQTVTHKVKKGEIMQSIAKYYGVSVKQILVANSLRSSQLKAGQLLNIELADTNELNHSKKTASKIKAAEKKKTYIVKQGDTLHSIAEKFDVAVTDLKHWNKKSSSHIMPGATLIVQ
jgi:membrane-bound lytic murein transglycosylase D